MIISDTGFCVSIGSPSLAVSRSRSEIQTFLMSIRETHLEYKT